MERVTDLREPPVVGRFYLVPTVTHCWSNRTRAWPVFLPKHDDARFFNFADEHYHLDPRFIDTRTWAAISGVGWRPDASDYGFAIAQAKPLHRHRWGPGAVALPPVVWRARKCQRDAIPYQHGSTPQVQAIQAHYAGEQCRRNRAGWVCPHQKWGMGSLAPDADGVITCPLHGLRVRAADGVVLTPATCQAEAA